MTCPEEPFGGDPADLDYNDYPVYIEGTDRRFTSIQNGIWGADEGDVVLVCPGTYFEVVDFKGKIITVRSVAGPTETTIDALGQGPAVRLRNWEPAETVLEGFMITGGVGEDHHGGGIFVEYGSPTIQYNVVVHNTAGIGAGIYVRNGGANVRHNIVAWNHADEGGGGIVCTACVGEIAYNNFYQNTADRFGPYAEWYWGIADMVGNLVVLEDDEDKPALYYREHRGEDFTTGPNGLWPDITKLEGEAEEDWPEGEWVVADPLWADPSNGDFSLMAGSPAIDAGPADVADDDGSLADLGAFGGPGGDWPYAL